MCWSWTDAHSAEKAFWDMFFLTDFSERKSWSFKDIYSLCLSVPYPSPHWLFLCYSRTCVCSTNGLSTWCRAVFASEFLTCSSISSLSSESLLASELQLLLSRSSLSQIWLRFESCWGFEKDSFGSCRGASLSEGEYIWLSSAWILCS